MSRAEASASVHRSDAVAPRRPLTYRGVQSRSIRHTVGKEHGRLRMNQAPVLPPSGPFLRNIHHGQIQHFQQAVIRRENRFCLGHFPKLPVKALDCIGCIDQAAHLLRVLEISAQVGPILPPGRSDLRVFFVPFLRKGIQSIQRSSLIRCGIETAFKSAISAFMSL